MMQQSTTLLGCLDIEAVQAHPCGTAATGTDLPAQAKSATMSELVL